MESEVINSYKRVKAVADAARQGLTYNALQALNATENAFNVSGVDGILAHSDWLIESFGDCSGTFRPLRQSISQGLPASSLISPKGGDRLVGS